METVTHEYLIGIREGRELKARFKPDLAGMRAYLASCEDTMREFGPGPVKDILRGERDFWRSQIKIKILERVNS